jgi:hypothetical protein
MNAIRLRKLDPDWAITSRGNRVSLPAYAILIGGIEAGRISSFLARGGGRGWSVESPRIANYRHNSRAEAVKAILNYVEALQ